MSSNLTFQHIAAAVTLALTYHFTEGRLSLVLLLSFAYFLYVREFCYVSSKPDQEKTPVPETEHKHKHEGGKGGCGKLCTCKSRKDAPKKTLSALKFKKGFGQKTPAETEKAVAVDFTTAFAKPVKA